MTVRGAAWRPQAALLACLYPLPTRLGVLPGSLSLVVVGGTTLTFPPTPGSRGWICTACEQGWDTGREGRGQVPLFLITSQDKPKNREDLALGAGAEAEPAAGSRGSVQPL